jgi:hypothetical protein
MGEQSKNSKKVPFNVRKPLVKLPGVESNIHYASKTSDKKLQDKIAQVNRD